MVAAPGVSLAKVTVKAPHRWIDVALPADVPVAELLPYVLRHAGEDAADAGERHAGWLLRRPTGESLEPQKTLDAQRVRDGELLHLVPGEVEWPELEYEDLVETIASGARRSGRSWGATATRRCGLTLGGVVLTAAALIPVLGGPPWRWPGLLSLAVALVLMASAVVVARALPDARAGAVLGGASLPHAFMGGLLLTGPAHASVTGLGPAQLMLGATTLLVFGIAGFVGIAVLGRVFAAAIAAGGLALLAGLVGGPLGADGAAAVVLAVGIGLLPGYPLLAVRLGRLPLPRLPQRAADLLVDEESPPAPGIFAAAARTDEILSGLLTGLSIASLVAVVFLTGHGGVSHQLLLVAVAAALLLRARLFPVLRQRVPLLSAGALTAALLAGSRIVEADLAGLALWLLLVVVAGLLVVVAGLVYSRSNPSPYLGRAGDILDVVAVLALIPLVCFITGLYGYVQSLLAGIG